MENIQLTIYKALLNFEKISVLDFMRENREFLDYPGYEISKILNDGVKEGYIERFEDKDKMYYSATDSCREFLERIEKEAIEKAQNEKREELLKRKKAKNKLLKKIIIVLVIIMMIIGVVMGAFAVISKIKRDKAIEKYGEEFVANFEKLESGDEFVLGKYEQDGDTTNGSEEIEWIVLDVKDGKALLVSKYILSRTHFNNIHGLQTWESCSARFWLNDSFKNECFNEKEMSLILLTHNKKYSYCEDSDDYFFLLSVDEAENYIVNSNIKLSGATKSAQSDDKYENYWWLRTPGDNKWETAYVYDSGGINEDGAMNDAEHGYNFGIRPAMWISIYN